MYKTIIKSLDLVFIFILIILHVQIMLTNHVQQELIKVQQDLITLYKYQEKSNNK